MFFLGGGDNRFIYVSEFRDPPPHPNLGRRRRARRVRRPRRLPRRELRRTAVASVAAVRGNMWMV